MNMRCCGRSDNESVAGGADLPEGQRLSPEEIMEIFRRRGAYLKGHFLLTSGLHSGEYVEKFNVLQYPEDTDRLCREIAARFAGDKIDLVVGPATGGIILSHVVGRYLGTRAVFTERENGVMKLRRGFGIEKGERVLVVEDVVTTGGSVFEVLDIIRDAGGDIVGLGLLVNRSGGRVDFGIRTEALLKLDIKAYKPEECPLCRDGIPMTQRGSRGI